ncbi:MAG: CBS domain-containing protein [Magnetococcales bacterium]|nr:CBS domain-containing protein [Magnetococcales bacterium]
MEIPDKTAKKVRPFFLNFFQKLSDNLNTLINAPVECTITDVALLRGEEDLSDLFESETSVTYTLEDGLHTGDMHLVMDAAAAIGLSGLMMMLPQAVVQKTVKTREYTDEIREGFHEVANQIVGSLNDRVEEKLAGGHLFVEAVEHVGIGAVSATLDPTVTYLDIGMDVKVSDFRSASAHWLFSRGLANALLKLDIPGSPEELAREAAQAGVVEEEVKPAEVVPEAKPVPDDFQFDANVSDYLARSTRIELPNPDEPGGVRVVMTLPPFALNENEEVMRAVTAAFQEGRRYVGVDRQGTLIRVVSPSDLRRIMGAFYGSKAVTPREKALLNLPVGKLNETQKLVTITPKGTIEQAADLLKTNNLFALPVVNGSGVLRGFVPIHAVIEYFRKRA